MAPTGMTIAPVKIIVENPSSCVPADTIRQMSKNHAANPIAVSARVFHHLVLDRK